MRDASYSRSRHRDASPPGHGSNQRHEAKLLATRVMTLEDFLHDEEVLAVEGVEGASCRPIPVLLRPGETTEAYEQRFERWLLRRNLTKAFILLCAPEVERRFRLDFADSRAWELRRLSIAQQQYQHKEKTEKVSRRHVYYGIRSRAELLATEVMTGEEYFQAMEDEGIDGRLTVSQRLRRIPLVLNPRESVDKYEANFKRWLANTHMTMAELETDPEEERRYRQSFARARACSWAKRDHYWKSLDELPPRSKTQSHKRAGSEVSELDKKAKRPRIDGAGGDSAAKGTSTRELEEVCDPSSGSVQEDVCHEARVMMSKVKLMKASLPDEELVTSYTIMNDQIALNEMAMKDALKFVKVSEKSETAESLQQIEELAMVIKQEKRRRDAALAAVLAEDWKGRQEQLEQLLEAPVDVEAPSVCHETLATIFAKLGKTGKEVDTLYAKLAQLNPDDSSAREELQDLSTKLRAALEKQAQLAEQRKSTSLNLLRSNVEMRMLTLELLAEAEGVWD